MNKSIISLMALSTMVVVASCSLVSAGENIDLNIVDWINQRRMFGLNVNADISIKDLRELVAGNLSASPEKVCMLCRFNKLEDSHSLSDYKLENDAADIQVEILETVDSLLKIKFIVEKKMFKFEIIPQLPIKFLRNMIGQELNVPVEHISMIYVDNLMEDSKVVGDYIKGDDGALVNVKETSSTHLDVLNAISKKKLLELEVNSKILIRDLRQIIAEKLIAPPALVALMTRTKTLQDSNPLNEYEIEKGELYVDVMKVHLNFILSGEKKKFYETYVLPKTAIKDIRFGVSKVKKVAIEAIALTFKNQAMDDDSKRVMDYTQTVDINDIIVEIKN